MKILVSIALGFGFYSAAQAVQAQATFTGDKKYACEAIMCLASGSPPHECQPSIRKYLSIHKRKPSDTIKARRNFLKLCPSSNDSQGANLVEDIVQGRTAGTQPKVLDRFNESGSGDGNTRQQQR